MDLVREELELTVLGELFIDADNNYIDNMKRDWFSLEENKKVFDFLTKHKEIRIDDLLTMKFELDKEYQPDESKKLNALVIRATIQAICVDLLPNHLKMLQEIQRNEKINELYINNKGNFSDSDIRKLHSITDDNISQVHTPKLEDLALAYTDLLEERGKIHGSGAYQNATGFAQLDKQIGGIMPKNITTIGGRTSMGKTAFMTNIAVNLAKRDRKVLYISCEMSEIELFDRIISAQSGVEAYKLRFGRLKEEEVKRIISRLNEKDFFKKNLWLHYKPGISLSGIKERINLYNPDIVIVDHIQLIKAAKEETQAQAISNAMYQLADIAGEKDIGVVIGSQMSRESVKHGAKDFSPIYYKGSGGIEEASSVCCEIKMIDPTQKENRDITVWDINFEITKNRHGRTGRLVMKFDRQILLFTEAKDETNNN